MFKQNNNHTNESLFGWIQIQGLIEGHFEWYNHFMHQFFKLCIQNSKWSARYLVVWHANQYYGPHNQQNWSWIWCCKSSKLLSVEGGPLLHQWQQNTWQYFYSTHFDSTLGLHDDQRSFSKTTCGLEWWL